MRRSSIALVASLIAVLSCNTPETNDSITIGFVGDILLDRGVRSEISKRGIDRFYQSLSEQLIETGYLVGNLECPLTESMQPVHKKYVFRGDTIHARYLRGAGFTHLNMANNHSYDQSRAGMVTTAQTLKHNNMEPLGYNDQQLHACEPTIISQNGIAVALFSSVTLALENWFPNPDKPGMCQEGAADLTQRIAEYAQNNPTHQIVVYLHWGIEHVEEASPDQRAVAQSLIDAGADLIVGHHPHVLQPHQRYKGKHIFYSLGNFIFDQTAPSNSKSSLLEVRFHQTGYEVTSVGYEIRDCLPVRVN